MTSRDRAIQALSDAREALDRIGKRVLDPETINEKNVVPELVRETKEFNTLSMFLSDDPPETLEDAIQSKLCSSSWCSCHAEPIAEAVREYLAQKIKEE